MAAFFQITEGELRRELVAMTDSFTDELFDLEGAGKLIFPVSRLLVDPERFERDEGTGEKGGGFQRTQEAVTGALQRILRHWDDGQASGEDPNHV